MSKPRISMVCPGYWRCRDRWTTGWGPSPARAYDAYISGTAGMPLWRRIVLAYYADWQRWRTFRP